MTAAANPLLSELLPGQVWGELEGSADAALIDVRTRPEWAFVGVPDLSRLGREAILIEWRRYPDMSVNPTFVDDLLAKSGGRLPSHLYFICRSGVRSFEAARHVAEVAAAGGSPTSCINVAEGFEGDLDENGHRGTSTGWKARGLAWRQF